MITIFFRTVLIYALLIVVLRLTGKRQIGELEISDLVTTLLISEIASLPIEDPEIPILYAVIPIVTLLFFEVGLSALLIKIPVLRGILSSRPAVLVRDGKPNEKELRAARISVEELLSALRQKDAWELSAVDRAILEQNGQISVLQKDLASDASEKRNSGGVSHILIADGKIRRHTLRTVPHAKEQLRVALHAEHCKVKDVFLLLINDAGKPYLVPKERKAQKI